MKKRGINIGNWIIFNKFSLKFKNYRASPFKYLTTLYNNNISIPIIHSKLSYEEREWFLYLNSLQSTQQLLFTLVRKTENGTFFPLVGHVLITSGIFTIFHARKTSRFQRKKMKLKYFNFFRFRGRKVDRPTQLFEVSTMHCAQWKIDQNQTECFYYTVKHFGSGL